MKWIQEEDNLSFHIYYKQGDVERTKLIKQKKIKRNNIRSYIGNSTHCNPQATFLTLDWQ